MPHDTAPDDTTHAGGPPHARRPRQAVIGGRGDAVAYQSTQLTAREPGRLLEDLAALDVSGVRISERGDTYLVFAPQKGTRYTATLAVTLAVIIAIGDLVATAASVLWIALLPLALIPFVPLLLDDRPQLAVGAVPADDYSVATRVTAHGRVWGDLGAALDAYLSNIPPAAATPIPAAGAAAAHEETQLEVDAADAPR